VVALVGWDAHEEPLEVRRLHYNARMCILPTQPVERSVAMPMGELRVQVAEE
jgi:hypothetical protein